MHGRVELATKVKDAKGTVVSHGRFIKRSAGGSVVVFIVVVVVVVAAHGLAIHAQEYAPAAPRERLAVTNRH